MAAGKICMLLLLLAFALLSPIADARKAIFSQSTKRDIKYVGHDSHEGRRKIKYNMMNRWLGVIVVRPAPCPAGQQIDMLGLCRPVHGREGGARPLPPAFFFGEYTQLYSDYDPHAPRDRPTRLARLHNNVIT